MQPITKRWQVADQLSEETDHNLRDYHPIVRQILSNRGYTTKESTENFLATEILPGTDPKNLTGMDQAIERISWAIQNNEPIAIYGDYDVDGVTATALLTQVLEYLGADVVGYIPNRFDEGYGLNNDALGDLWAQGVRLVITVDCGIRSPNEAGHAKQLGLDLIISDHHRPAAELPEVVSIINPKQPGDNYPFKELAGVGLAYKIAEELVGQDDPICRDLLDLVALGTVADMVPLVSENRFLVRAGLEAIKERKRLGLQSLIGVAGLNPNKASARSIGYVLGPRLNAAGRLDTAEAALQLLLTEDVYRAGELAQVLEYQNRERQQITRRTEEHAEKLALADDPEAFLLFAVHQDYNVGVVGLAASRLTERYYRPAIVAHRGEKFTRGSCRSIPEFHITEALDQCANLMERHGGHAAAAGLTIRNERVPELIEQMKAIADEKLYGLDLKPTLRSDIELSLSQLDPTILIPFLKQLEPTGIGNPQARFISRELKVTRHKAVGRDEAHLRLTVKDGTITYDAIAFRQGHWKYQMPPFIDLLYTFEENEYQGRINLQLNVIDIKESGTLDSR